MTESSTKQKEKGPDVEVKVGPPLIQTFEDAREAYLREQIDEEEFKRIAGRYGHANSTVNWIPSRLERPDTPFHRDLPEEFFDQPGTAILPVEEQLKIVQKRDELRKAATEASEKVVAEIKPEVDAATAKNEAARKATEKPQEALDNTIAKAIEDAPKAI